MGVSFKIEKRRNRCPVIGIKVQESLDFVLQDPPRMGWSLGRHAPSAFAALTLRNLSRSLFFSSF
jgi:hypothetical protein